MLTVPSAYAVDTHALCEQLALLNVEGGADTDHSY